MSFLFLFGGYTVLLDDYDFSVLLTVSIFFVAEIRGVMDYFTTLGFFPFFVYHVSITFFGNRISSSDQCLFGFIQIPNFFLTFSLGLSNLFGNRSLTFEDMTSVLDILHPVNSRIKV